MKYKTLFSPMKIGNVEIKNRVVMSPMLMGFGQFNGNATDKMINYYEARAKGGAGLIITEITRINDLTGASSFGQLAASKDRNVESISRLAERIHKYGAKVFVQLHHPGRQNVSLMINTVPVSVFCDKIMPKNLYSRLLYKSIVPFGKKLAERDLLFKTVAPSRSPKSKFAESENRELTVAQIKKIVSQFASAAKRVKSAGCDGVEIHASHGYLIQQFLSPVTNRRTDRYGGSLENRMRFLFEIIDSVRESCGSDFPIAVRLTVDEMYEKTGRDDLGYTLFEGIKMAKLLEEKGIDAIDVSSGGYDTFNYWLEPASFECGWRKNLAAAVKKAVHIPVIAANLIRSPEQAEKQLEDGIQDFVSLGRPHIADPEWSRKAMQGREDEIKRCICCLYCFQSMTDGAYTGDNGHCSVNPFVGRENEKMPENGDGRNIVIVGAGVAGLTAAEILAKRKFNVTVLEKESAAGGQINLADKPPHKDKIHWCIEDLLVNAQKAGARIIYHSDADKEMISSFNPFAVIVATGAEAVMPEAFRKRNTYSVTEILNGSVTPKNKKICVIGSGMTGLETSELLCSLGNKVCIVEMIDKIAPGAWFQHTDDILPKLEKYGTVFFTSSKLTEISNDGIFIENTATGKKDFINCDAVVLSLGVKSNKTLYEEIKNSFDNVYNIGDSSKAGRIHDATESAYRTVMSIN